MEKFLQRMPSAPTERVFLIVVLILILLMLLVCCLLARSIRTQSTPTPVAEPTETPTLTGTPPPTATPTMTTTPSPTATCSTTCTPSPTATPTATRTPTTVPTPALWLKADPAQVVPPCCSELSWKATNAETVYLDGNEVSLQGKQKVCPREPSSHTLRAVSAAYGDLSQSVTVDVLPVTVQFSIDDDLLHCGESTALHWAVANARDVFLNGERVAPQDDLLVTPTGDTTYELRVAPPCGQDRVRQIAVEVVPPEVSFYVDPAAIYPECETATLKWDVDNIRAVYLDGQGVAGHGQIQVYYLREYVLLVDTLCGSIEKRVTLQELPGPQIEFWADNTQLACEESTTLHWQTEYIREVYLDGEGQVGDDSIRVSPTSDTTYTLLVVTPCGEVRRQVRIEVEPCCQPMTGVGFSAYNDISYGQVYLNWEAGGDCTPINGTITSRWVEGDVISVDQVSGASGTLTLNTPRCPSEGTFYIEYTLNLRDSSGQSVSASDEIRIFCVY